MEENVLFSIGVMITPVGEKTRLSHGYITQKDMDYAESKGLTLEDVINLKIDTAPKNKYLKTYVVMIKKETSLSVSLFFCLSSLIT